MILRKMRQSWLDRDQSFNSIMLWAASLVTFFSSCRSGEITVEDENKYDPSVHLSFSDVAIDNAGSPNIISLNIKRSKTDQGAVGVRVILGRTDNDLCPISALLVYLARRGNTPGALFQWDNRTPLSKTKFVDATHQALSAANLPAKDYTGHSFRLGAATTAATAGLEDWKTQPSKLLDDGRVLPTSFTSEPTLNS